MKGISRPVLRVLLLLLAVLALAAVLKEAVAPGLVRRRLIAAVQDGCGSCRLSIGRVRVSLLPPALSCSRVRFTGGEADTTAVEAAAARVHVPFSLNQLLKGRLRTGRIEIDQPAVTVTEGDLASPASAEDAGAKLPDIEIEGIKIDKAVFVYIRQHPGRQGRLTLSRINAGVGPIGSSARLKGAYSQASVSGLLEGSGEILLQVKARVLAEAPDADIELSVTGQDLSKLNPFFGPVDGIKLKGEVLEGRSSVAIRGAGLKASAYMRYRGLSVRLKKNKERGAFSAFFQSLAASVAIGKQNSDGGAYDRRGAAELRRKPPESVISFALRGMKDAAMQIPVKGGK